MDYQSILLSVLLISGSVLCISLIFYLKRVVSSIIDIKKDINKIATDLEPLVNSLVKTSDSVAVVTRSVSEQLYKTNWIIDEVKNRVESLITVESKIKQSIEYPTNTLYSNLSAAKNAIAVFWRNYKKNK